MPRIRFRVDNDSPAQSHSTVQHVVELQTGSNAASASPAISDTLMSDTRTHHLTRRLSRRASMT